MANTKEKYRLTIKGISIFGGYEQEIIIYRKYDFGFGAWRNGKLITPGKRYIPGSTLKEIIARLEEKTEYTGDKKVIKVEKL